MHQRHCRYCKGWHDLDQPWPDNCLPPRRLTRSDLATPMVVRDIPDYRSPVDGRVIGSRSTRREDLKRNGCVEWEPGIGKGRYKRTPGEVHNPKYEGSGLKLSELGQARKEKMRKEKMTYQQVIAAESAGKRT
jgi:hypothetical protein